MMNLQYVVEITDSQINGWTPLEIYSQIMWYYIFIQRGSNVSRPSSVILLGEGGKERLRSTKVHVIIIVKGALMSTVRHLSYYWEKEERKRLSSTKVQVIIIVNPQNTWH